jgi:outer membrane immunogenic protein
VNFCDCGLRALDPGRLIGARFPDRICGKTAMSRLQPLISAILRTAAALLLAGGVFCETAHAGAPIAPGYGVNSASSSSWVAGGHAGYNWQNGSQVFGFETDLSGTHLGSSMHGVLTFTPALNLPSQTATNALIDWYGTFRGRFGITNGPALFYGTAGLAYGHVGLSSAINALGVPLYAQTSSTRAGWVGGAGVDYMVSPNLFLNLNYQYVDLGTLSLAGSTAPGFFGFTNNQAATAHAQFHTVMLGFSWRFAPTGPGWQGGYAGGQLGGAFGLHTNAVYSETPIFVSDARLKHDITLVARREDGLGIYRFKYLWSEQSYVGVMAQEVALVHPEAVVRDPFSGYLAVNYARLGLRMVAVAE